MTRFIFLLTTLLPSISEAGETYYSYAFGKTYKCEISDDALKRAPIWTDDSENPPLSARKAIKAADELRLKLVQDTENLRWRRESAGIRFIEGSDRCVWEVIYHLEPKKGALTGSPINLRLFVLMDGTLVNPEVSAHKGQ